MINLQVRSIKSRLYLCSIIAFLIIVISIIAPFLNLLSPNATTLKMRLQPPGSYFENGKRAYFGTDALGRDVFSRILYGSRVSFIIAFFSIAVALLIGLILGLISGFYGGKIDVFIMRIVEVQLSFPSILLAVIFVSIMGASIVSLVIALGLSRWVVFARLVRGRALEIKEKEFIKSCKALGLSDSRIMMRHIFPNLINVILIIVTLELGRIILAEAALSFIGLGIQPPTPSWGSMVSEGREYLHNAWWVSTFPGLVLSFTVTILGLLGDSIRDYLDPYLKDI